MLVLKYPKIKNKQTINLCSAPSGTCTKINNQLVLHQQENKTNQQSTYVLQLLFRFYMWQKK